MASFSWLGLKKSSKKQKLGFHRTNWAIIKIIIEYKLLYRILCKILNNINFYTNRTNWAIIKMS